MWSELYSAVNQPDDEEAKELSKSYAPNCKRAAQAIKDSDVLLVVTGAGWSADSGLATYGDVAKVPAYQERDLDYSDICMMDWLFDEPDLFYGFWGQCFNDYRSTEPHPGYQMIAKWRDDKNAKGAVAQEIQKRIARKVELRRPFDDEIVQRYTPYPIADGEYAGAFFSFTSNVDAHWFDVLEAHEIHECHGNIELWQCSDPYCPAGIWRAPIEHCFEVDCETMLAPATKIVVQQPATAPASPSASEAEAKGNNTTDNVAHIGQTKGSVRSNTLKNMPLGMNEGGWHWPEEEEDNPYGDTSAPAKVSNWPKCGKCQALARPAILMFGDFRWKRDISQSERWNLWKEAVLDLCEKCEEESNPLKICIVEIGCGLNVPTCRSASERMVVQVQRKGGEVKLVRINPDFPLTGDEDTAEVLIPIMARGLESIEQIDKMYKEAV